MKIRALPIQADPRMNKWEREYAGLLELRKRCGELASWRFEAFKLRLGLDWTTTYTPDFMLVLPDGIVELHEVKGFWRDDARVKIKVAASEYPEFRFVAVSKQKGQWTEEQF